MNASYLQGIAFSVTVGGLACSSMAPKVAASHPTPASATGAVLAPAPSRPSAPPAAPDAGSPRSDPAQSPPAQEPPWQATLVQASGLDVGEFAVAAGPGPEHPKGMISALAWTASDPPDLYVVTIDVATVQEVGRVLIGPYHSDESGAIRIASASGGVVVAWQGRTSIELTWVDGGLVLGARRNLPGLGVDSAYDFRGLADYGDRLVLADGGDAVTLRVLDQNAHLVARHKCHGTLFSPGPALFQRFAGQVVLINLSMEDGGGTPICSVGLGRGTPWQEASLPWGEVTVSEGTLYFTVIATGLTRVLGPDLRPTGEPVTLPKAAARFECSGLTGRGWDSATVGGFEVVYTTSCCGEPSRGGLFVCRPPATGL
jgi:hypothetical protein